MAYTPAQIYAALTAQGVPAGDAATLTQISGAESSYGANPVSGVNHNGSIDYGVFQINNAAHPQFGGSAMATAPLDQQAAAAASIWKSQGLGAWSTYNSGAYKTYSAGGPGGTVVAGPPDSSSGLNAGSGSGLASTAEHLATAAATTAGNAALMAMGLPPVLSSGSGGDTVNVGVSPEGASTIGGWITGIETATGNAFNKAVDHALSVAGISASAMQNWFVRAGVIMLGLVIIFVGLIALAWDHGGKEVVSKIAPAALAA